MKISYRTYPILKYIKEKSLDGIQCFDIIDDREYIDKVMNAIELQFSMSCNGVNIYAFERTFIEAYERAADKLMEAFMWESVDEAKRYCFLNSKNKEQTIFQIINERQSGKIMLNWIDLIENVLVSNGTYLIEYGEGIDKFKRTFFGWNSKNINNAEAHIFNCAIMTLFIKYAETETKLLPPGQKIKGINCNYKNETKLPITILNSTWFTNLVKSDAFKVRGHFRLQACGHEMKDRKLIWINEFMKEGYTAPARKLNDKNQ